MYSVLKYHFLPLEVGGKASYLVRYVRPSTAARSKLNGRRDALFVLFPLFDAVVIPSCRLYGVEGLFKAVYGELQKRLL